jgi:hypothetical protein
MKVVPWWNSLTEDKRQELYKQYNPPYLYCNLFAIMAIYNQEKLKGNIICGTTE